MENLLTVFKSQMSDPLVEMEALSALEQLLGELEHRNRKISADADMTACIESIANHVSHVLASEGPEVSLEKRRKCVEVLHASCCASSIPALLDQLRSDDAHVRLLAGNALVAISPKDPKEACAGLAEILDLEKVLEDEDVPAIKVALSIIRDIGSNGMGGCKVCKSPD